MVTLLCLGAGGVGCKKSNGFSTAIIKYLPPCYVIETNNQQHYVPMNLSDEFKVHNLRVKIVYQMTDEERNCFGYFQVINLLKIEKL